MTATDIARSLHARRIGKGKWMAKCCAHDDRDASLSITDMGNGRTRLHCFAGCEQQAILDSMGLGWGDVGNGNKTPDPFWEQQRRDREHLELLERQEGLAIMAQAVFPDEREHWEEVESTCALEARELRDSLNPTEARRMIQQEEVQRIISEYGIPELMECLPARIYE